MSDPESGTGTNRVHAAWVRPLPEGWVASETISTLLRPDPRSSDHPRRLESFEPNAWARLNSDPDLQKGWEAHRDELNESLREWLWLDPDAPDRDERFAKGLSWTEAVLTKIGANYGPKDIPARARALFLWKRSIADSSPELQEAFSGVFDPLEPIEIFANVGDTPVALEVLPGSFAMHFAGATGEDRSAFDGLIQRMQKAFGYPTRGGRPPRSQQARGSSAKTDPVVVARLRRQGRDTADIAHILAAAYPSDGWEGTYYQRSDGLARRIKRYADEGDQLLDHGK